ncbi:MAG TPA: methyltransferase domain-containing protein [Rhizomicrobium sp.]|jgi:phosphatidylethanolamine/phosphatidyl-N-methylethanolamine N-methyltransferase|nr:methyltransferase domain-containing protein [Rhizomicrobium sp.]
MALTHDARFFRGFLAHPLAVGAVAPSSPDLAAAIAEEMPPRGRVLELGAGTGAVTEALLARGLTTTAIEYDPGFAAHLRTRYPSSEVLQGDAFTFDRLIAHGARFDGIVSGLPVVGRSTAQRASLLRLALSHLEPGAPFVQFSYAPWPPYPRLAHVSVSHAPTFWRNIPPMHIWVHRALH